jgi:DDE family transposase
MLRPAKRPSGKEAERFLRRLLPYIRANWPRTEILLRADSHCCVPETIDFCRANGLDFASSRTPCRTISAARTAA